MVVSPSTFNFSVFSFDLKIMNNIFDKSLEGPVRSGVYLLLTLHNSFSTSFCSSLPALLPIPQTYFFSTQSFASTVSSDLNDPSVSMKEFLCCFPIQPTIHFFRKPSLDKPECSFQCGLPILLFYHSFDFWFICVVCFYYISQTTRRSKYHVFPTPPLCPQY